MESKNQHVPNSNPQDPTLPTDVEVSENREHVSEGKTKLEKKTDLKKRKRKRGRTVGVATVVEQEISQEPRLSQNQYRIILRRRALRKQDGHRRDPPRLDANNPEFEAYGDISLGMKLNVVSGRVIVQALIPLEDGRASPAQLSGLIQRGDILISIGDVNLVNIPIDQLRDGLRPLNTPDSKGVYQGTLDMCFAAGEGLQALTKNQTTQANQAAGNAREAIANEVAAFFPIVEPLHGAASPIENRNFYPADNLMEKDKKDQKLDPRPPIPPPLPIIKAQSRAISVMPISAVNAEISQSIAIWRARDRDNFMGEYFLWNEQFSNIMSRCSDVILPTKDFTTRQLTRSERLLLGNKAILGAKNLGSRIEKLDKGEDLRSFRQWNSTISLRSRASNRRHYFLELASLPAHFETTSEAENPASTIMSDDSGGVEEDSDDVLLNLAAHDEIWREQVLTALGKAGDELDGKQGEKQVASEEQASPSDLEDVLSNDFGALLLGNTMSKVVSKKNKPVALPPEEITSVLFDLSTHIASTMPDEITFINGTSSHVPKLSPPYSITKPTTEKSHSMSLATRFLLDDALPMWLKTFRPLTWDYRRILWPLDTTQNGQGDFHISDADSLTFDGSLTSSQRPTRKTRRRQSSKKSLRENIEEKELNVQTRSETCFLVTYFFAQKLLAQAALSQNRSEKDFDVSQEILVDFVSYYGAYLQLNTCLAYSASLKCKDVIAELLRVAQEDPRHREVVKLFNKRNALVPYDQSMLSAAVNCLPNIVSANSGDRRQFLIDICVSAYPGICPWQVRTACLGSVEGGNFKALYYNYLTQLLHPVDGSEHARKDRSLVKEWCELSIENNGSSPGYKPRSKSNFLLVASRHSMAHTAFVRDVILLFELSQKISDDGLVLDLADEILDQHDIGRNKTLASNVIGNIRKIAFKALDAGSLNADRQLKRCMQLMQKMENLIKGDQLGSLANEMKTLLEYRSSKAGGDINKVLELVYHFAHESKPDDFLKALALWEMPAGMESFIVPVLQSVLKIGTSIAMDSELSGSLFRLHRARLRNSYGSGMLPRPLETKRSGSNSEKSLWDQMATGVLTVDK